MPGHDRRPYTTAENRWRLQYRGYRGPDRHNVHLSLSWELHADPISDDYTPAEISAVDLLRLWLDSYYPEPVSEEVYGPGMVQISWFVEANSDECSFLEAAPFTQGDWGIGTDFLTELRTPRSELTGASVNWLRLPVEDKLWRRGRADKGGFLQEATGWKPSPYQPAAHIPSILAASGLRGLVPYQAVDLYAVYKARQREAV